MAADPTLQQVCDRARWHLGDTQVSGGETYTNTLLIPWVQEAYEDMQRAVRNLQLIRARREGFLLIPAQTSQIDPTIQLPDFMNLLSLDDRLLGDNHLITAVTLNSPTTGWITVTTSTSHGRAVGDQIEITGISGVRGVNCSMTINGVPAANQFTAQCYGAGTPAYSANWSMMLYGTESFWPVIQYGQILNQQTTGLVDRVMNVALLDKTIRYSPVQSAREWRVLYESDDGIPSATSDTMGLEDSLGFMSTWTAYKAARAKGALAPMAQELKDQALGINGSLDSVRGGLLRALLMSIVRTSQRRIHARPKYRLRRQLIGYY